MKQDYRLLESVTAHVRTSNNLTKENCYVHFQNTNLAMFLDKYTAAGIIIGDSSTAKTKAAEYSETSVSNH